MKTARIPIRFFLTLVIAAAAMFIGIRTYYRTTYPVRYETIVSAEAERYDLSESLIYAVIKCESGFDPEAVSSVGALGLMQITGETFDWISWKLGEDGSCFESLYDPQTNIRYGSFLLKMLLDEFGEEKTALAAYHAGIGRVRSWLQDESISSDGVNLDRIPFEDTRKYVSKVMKTKERYEKLYNLN